MKKYKPEFLGKVLPTENTTKMTEFVNNKYQSFCKIYDKCKDNCDKINDVKIIEKENEKKNELSIKISTNEDVLDNISKNIDEENISIENDIITVNINE